MENLSNLIKGKVRNKNLILLGQYFYYTVSCQREQTCLSQSKNRNIIRDQKSEILKIIKDNRATWELCVTLKFNNKFMARVVSRVSWAELLVESTLLKIDFRLRLAMVK